MNAHTAFPWQSPSTVPPGQRICAGAPRREEFGMMAGIKNDDTVDQAHVTTRQTLDRHSCTLQLPKWHCATCLTYLGSCIVDRIGAIAPKSMRLREGGDLTSIDY